MSTSRIAALLIVTAGALLISCTDWGSQPVLPVPQLTLVGSSAAESDSLECEILLNGRPATPVVVILSTRTGTAESGTDFIPTLDTVTIHGQSGPDSARGWLSIPTSEDTLIEPVEEFFVAVIEALNAEVAISEVPCSIVDNDGRPKLSIANSRVFDGDTAVFEVILNKIGLEPVVFGYTSMGGTAESDLDFLSVTGTDSIPVGSLSTTVKVPTTGEYLAEETEHFGMTLSILRGAEGFDLTAVGYIVQPTRFSVHISPILGGHCAACHRPSSYASRAYYSVVGYDSLMLSGVHGPHVVPGHSEQSTLYLILLNPPPPGFIRMPQNSYLSDEKIKVFKDWIDQGAKNN